MSERITNGRKSDGRFAKGCQGGPGRPKGSKHRLSEDLLSALSTDFAEHGRDAIVKVREERPDQYLRICASLVPKDLNVTADNPLEDCTTEELDKAIRLLLDEIREQEATAEDDEAEADRGLH